MDSQVSPSKLALSFMSEFDVISGISKTGRLNHNVPRHICHCLQYTCAIDWKASQSASHSWPATSLLCSVYWSCPGPDYKQFHVMVVIFVVNYVFLHFTVSVYNEYRWENPKTLAPWLQEISLFRHEQVRVQIVLRAWLCHLVTITCNRKLIGKYRSHWMVGSLTDLYQISLLSKWHFVFPMSLIRGLS
jgi:hypothetical protein